MFVHDLSDVPLDLLKLLDLRGSSWRQIQVSSLLCLVVFMIGSFQYLVLCPTVPSPPYACLIFFQLVTLCITILTWLYWRIWIFCSVVLYAVAVDSKSMMNKTACKIGSCTWAETPERWPFVICLLILLGMSVQWLRRLCERAYKELSSTKASN